MPPPSPLPKFVYKILPEAPPQPLPSALPLSELDAKDGFVHLSTAEQASATAGRFFSTANKLWLLKIELDGIEKNVKWEDSGSGCYPHVYGPMLGKDEIADVKEFRKGEGEDWAVMLREDQWLS